MSNVEKLFKFLWKIIKFPFEILGKFCQEGDGKTYSSTRIMSMTAVFTGCGLAIVKALTPCSERVTSPIDDTVIIALVTTGLAGKAAQKFSERNKSKD